MASIGDGVGELGVRPSSRARCSDRRGPSARRAAQQRGVLVAAGFGGELAYPHGGLVQQLVDDPVHGARDLGALVVGRARAAGWASRRSSASTTSSARGRSAATVGADVGAALGRARAASTSPGARSGDRGDGGGHGAVGGRGRRRRRARSMTVDAGQLARPPGRRRGARRGRADGQRAAGRDRRARPRPPRGCTTGSGRAGGGHHDVHSGQLRGESRARRRPPPRRTTRPAARARCGLRLVTASGPAPRRAQGAPQRARPSSRRR